MAVAAVITGSSLKVTEELIPWIGGCSRCNLLRFGTQSNRIWSILVQNHFDSTHDISIRIQH